jgi:hypothetical protein
MINLDDSASAVAARRLVRVAQSGERPILLWIGAGPSRWLGYPSWNDLALQFRRTFKLEVLGFDDGLGMRLIDKQEFPAFFQLCRDANAATYRRLIAETFTPRASAPTYNIFIELLRKIDPTFVLTTNVDEYLGKNLPQVETVQRSDLTRCIWGSSSLSDNSTRPWRPRAGTEKLRPPSEAPLNTGPDICLSARMA